MIKHFLIAISLNLLLATAATAQVQVGLKAGSILADIATEIEGSSISDTSEPKLSYMAGGFASLPFNEKIGMQVELLYTNKGNKASTIEYKTNLHYINLPVLLQYKITDKLKVEAGPEIGYLLGAYSRDLSRQTSFEFNTIKDFDVGINAGVSYDLSEKLLLGLRYNLGVYDISKDITANDPEGNPYIFRTNAQNRGLQLSVGLKLFR